MSNAVGASRFRQATRELIKAISLGVTVKELDELFSLLHGIRESAIFFQK
jgi:hypothetical protein